ncbi:alpha/beta fold hydrolase [Paenibacillus lutimineralis]|uniref:Alpha/beta hydrolase n=1 Tax=Paenibacillus lutimineralis TaxID=2707005 RepID=A0A3S9V3W1_9BACL|nr:alpha/beta hydrolase [Paenibacillus lutimineralis]AZS17248.1 alpha/beta hydrolase [Paenibacillus lutimineralis]
MTSILANGISVAYQEQGQGQTIVLLHGFCGSSAYWEKLAPLLSREYHIVMPDLRGHGASGAPEGPYTIEQMADDIAVLMEQMGVPKYTLLGHSLGGYITLSLAERYSSRLDGFGLIHSTPYPDSEEAKEKRLKAVEKIQAEGIHAFVDGLVPGLFAPKHLQTMMQDVNRTKEIGYLTSSQGAQGAALAMRERVDRREVLDQSELPILLVAGENDGVIPLERTFTVEGDGVIKAVIKAAGHMGMYEAPDQLATVISDFMRNLA